jgi:hypothetical protein
MLALIKTVHTVVWLFFTTCILAVWAFALQQHYGRALVVSAIIGLEVAVLVVNRMKCPLTSLAEAYTSNREPNFDIFLPCWLARYNKQIFGTLYAAGLVLAMAGWRGWI